MGAALHRTVVEGSPATSGREPGREDQGNSARRSGHSTYAKGNFEFERVVTGWRASRPVLDLRLKR